MRFISKRFGDDRRTREGKVLIRKETCLSKLLKKGRKVERMLQEQITL
jgi:hypothetical protein